MSCLCDVFTDSAAEWTLLSLPQRRGDQTMSRQRYAGSTIINASRSIPARILRIVWLFGVNFFSVHARQQNRSIHACHGSHAGLALPGLLLGGWNTPPLQGSDMEPSPTSRVVALLAPHFFRIRTGKMDLWHSLESSKDIDSA